MKGKDISARGEEERKGGVPGGRLGVIKGGRGLREGRREVDAASQRIG
jgi:hypothetical protein